MNLKYLKNKLEIVNKTSDIKKERIIFIFAILIMEALGVVISTIGYANTELIRKSICSVTIDLLGITMVNVFVIGCIFDKSNEHRINLVFTNLLLAIDTVFLMDMGAWVFDNSIEPKYIALSFICNSFVYLSNICAILAFAIYMVNVCKTKFEWINTFLKGIVIYFAILTVLLIVNLKYRMVFDIVNGTYVRMGVGNVTFVTSSIILFIMLYVAVRQKMDKIEKAALICYILIPVIFVFIQMKFYGFGFISLGVFMSTAILYVQCHIRQGTLLQENKIELKNQQTATMLSQIQPHFIYNSLRKIAELCDSDPKLAKQAALDFSSFMEGIFSSLAEDDVISFEKELNHIKTYLRIEKNRFEDSLSIEYDIKEKGFGIPPLTVQPLVENAIRHGLSEKKSGGKIRIETHSDESGYYVIVEDNGVGFDAKDLFIMNQGGSLNSIRNRLESISKGTLEIASIEGAGTRASIFIPREA